MCVVRVRFFLFCATARHSKSTRIWLRADFRHARTSMNGIWRAMPPTVVTHCMCELSRTAQRWHAEPLLLSFIVRTFPRIYCVPTEKKIVAPKTSHLFSSILSYFRIFVRINSVTLVSHTAITQPVVHNEWRWIYDYRCTACDERTTAHHMLSKFFAIYSDRGVAGILPMEICFRSWSIKVTCVQLNRGIGRFGWCGTAKASELYIEYQPEQDKWYIFFSSLWIAMQVCSRECSGNVGCHSEEIGWTKPMPDDIRRPISFRLTRSPGARFIVHNFGYSFFSLVYEILNISASLNKLGSCAQFSNVNCVRYTQSWEEKNQPQNIG